ncbi:MAG: hypothetical protein ACLSVD_10030 [Eggerthellaceae bacterium]
MGIRRRLRGALVAPNYPLLLASRLLQAGGAGIALPLIQVVRCQCKASTAVRWARGLTGFAPASAHRIRLPHDFWGWRSVFVILGAVSGWLRCCRSSCCPTW